MTNSVWERKAVGVCGVLSTKVGGSLGRDALTSSTSLSQNPNDFQISFCPPPFGVIQSASDVNDFCERFSASEDGHEAEEEDEDSTIGGEGEEATVTIACNSPRL